MLIAANWKMNGTRAMASALISAIVEDAASLQAAGGELVICPPATLLAELCARAPEDFAQWGGQDCHAEAAGAFTGDISASMLADAGAGWVILGHSERRQGHGETDAQVAHKLQAAHDAGLKVMLCVGETLAEREAGRAEAVVAAQLAAAYRLHVAAVAYEPIWAIGTGKVASVADIAAMHAAIHAAIAPNCAVLYGGSVKAANAKEILATAGVDGVLVGGASLVEAEFCAILRAALLQQQKQNAVKN